MAYVPQEPSDFAPGLRGTATAYQTLTANHVEVYEDYEPPVLDAAPLLTIAAGVTATRVLAWRVRGNRDLRQIRVRVRATASGGTGTLIADVGGVTDTASVTVDAWYTMTITPSASGVVGCELRVTTPGGVSMSIDRVQVYGSAASPTAGRLASGYVRADSVDIYAADGPISSEHVTRWLTGPSCIARDRPIVCASHIARTTTSSAKSFANWQAYNSTAWGSVGRLRLIVAATRLYTIDAYMLESVGGGAAQLTIGSATWDIPTPGGTVGTWHSTSIELGAGEHDVRLAIRAGAGNSARMCTLQIWRAEP